MVYAKTIKKDKISNWNNYLYLVKLSYWADPDAGTAYCYAWLFGKFLDIE